MAQRTRSTNSTNLDSDPYGTRLVKRDKYATKGGPLQKCLKERAASNASMGVAATPPNLKSRPGTPRQQQNLPGKTHMNGNLIHNELISDNSALVEVTVRTHTNRRPSTGDAGVGGARKPWGKLLKSNKSNENLSSFGSFDPLRTLHFLAKELQSKLKTSDPNMTQIIADMRHALNRLPPEVASTIRLQNGLEGDPLQHLPCDIPAEKKFLLDRMDQSEKLTSLTIPAVDNKSCQTVTTITFADSESYHKQLEASTVKLEMSCRRLEKLCAQLKNEKEQLELLLHTEKDTVKFLRKQIQEMETEKCESRKFAFDHLTQERNNLQLRIKNLEQLVENQKDSSASKYKLRTQELQKEKTALEQDHQTLRRSLTLANLEKEKYVAILSIRDRQINEIRTEMNQLQEIVSDQLVELQNNPCISSPSSQNTILGGFPVPNWQQMEGKHGLQTHNGIAGNLTPPSSTNSTSPLNRLLYSNNQEPLQSFRPSAPTSSMNLGSLTNLP